MFRVTRADHSPRDVQRRLFDLHLALGAETGLPVVVHAREDVVIARAVRRVTGHDGGERA